MVRLFALLIFIFILVNLGWALVAMVKGKGDKNEMVKALTFRVIASIVLFMFVILAVYLTSGPA